MHICYTIAASKVDKSIGGATSCGLIFDGTVMEQFLEVRVKGLRQMILIRHITQLDERVDGKADIHFAYDDTHISTEDTYNDLASKLKQATGLNNRQGSAPV